MYKKTKENTAMSSYIYFFQTKQIWKFSISGK